MKAKYGFAGLVAATAMCCAVNSYAAEELSAEAKLLCDAGNMACGPKGASTKNAEPYILLEEEEVRIFDGKGKELYSLRGNRGGKRLASAIREVAKIADKKWESLSARMTPVEATSEYYKTLGKFRKTTRLNPKSLKFVDSRNKVFKEISLESQVIISTIPADSSVGKFYTGYKEETVRQAYVSYSQTAALVAQSLTRTIIPSYESPAVGFINMLSYYDVKGNLKWNKEFPDNAFPQSIQISADGDRIFYVNQCYEGCPDNFPYKYVVLNGEGKEIFNLDLRSASWNFCGIGPWFTSNGQYIIADYNDKVKGNSIVFDISKKLFWKAPYFIARPVDQSGNERWNGSKLQIDPMIADTSLGLQNLDFDKLTWEKLP